MRQAPAGSRRDGSAPRGLPALRVPGRHSVFAADPPWHRPGPHDPRRAAASAEERSADSGDILPPTPTRAGPLHRTWAGPRPSAPEPRRRPRRIAGAIPARAAVPGSRGGPARLAIGDTLVSVPPVSPACLAGGARPGSRARPVDRGHGAAADRQAGSFGWAAEALAAIVSPLCLLCADLLVQSPSARAVLSANWRTWPGPLAGLQP